MYNRRKIVFLAVCACLFARTTPFYAQAISASGVKKAAGANMPSDPTTEKLFTLKDIYRTEIISLGSLPFVTLFTTLGFSIANYVSHDFSEAYTPNPFAKSGAGGFTTDEQFQILFISLGISAGIGVTDLVVRVIKRAVARKKAEQSRQRAIKISPAALGESATRLPPPRNFSDTFSVAESSKKQADFAADSAPAQITTP